MKNFEIRVTADLLRPEVVGGRGQGISLCRGDSRAHRIIVDVVRGGQAVTLTGHVATAYAKYGDTTYQLQNVSIEGNTVTVVIDEAVYANADGIVTFSVKLSNGTDMVNMTVAVVIGVIETFVGDGAAVVPTSNAWTGAMVSAYLQALKNAVDTYIANGGDVSGGDDDAGLDEDPTVLRVDALEDDVEELQGDITRIDGSLTTMNTAIAGKQDKLTASGGVTISGSTISTKKIITAFKADITATKSAHTDVTWEYGYTFSDVPYIFVTPSATPQNGTSRCIYNGNISISVYAVTTTSCKFSIYNSNTSSNVSMGLALMAIR